METHELGEKQVVRSWASILDQTTDRLWDDRNAKTLLDEAPLAYKPIETVMEDSKDLVETVTVLKAFINYKGL